jgi:hypothetical protein
LDETGKVYRDERIVGRCGEFYGGEEKTQVGIFFDETAFGITSSIQHYLRGE